MRLARRWSQAMGVLIAVGAVTGTVLSFEMGLLWPGPDAPVRLGTWLPVRRRRALLLPRGDLRRGVPVGLAAAARLGALVVRSPDRGVGIFGAMSVVAVNSWMNQPGGFTQNGGQITSVSPWQVFFNHAAIYEMPHMILAAYMVAGFWWPAVYAAGILRGRRDRYHYTGFALGFVPAAILTPLQIFVGDTAARAIAHDQPVKFAAMEYVAQTSRQVPEWIAGVYINGHIYAGIKIPYLDSVLVGFGPGRG